MSNANGYNEMYVVKCKGLTALTTTPLMVTLL